MEGSTEIHKAIDLRSLSAFISTWGIFWIASIIFLLLFGYQGSFLALNQLRWNFLDVLFPHFTHLADGATIPAIFVLFHCRKNPALALQMLIGLILVSLAVFFLKNIVFEGWYRPYYYFEGRPDFYYIAKDLLKYRSFPSGHSASAAAIACLLALGLTKPYQVGIAFISIVTAYTRLYIGVHFLGDIIAGTILGTVIMIIVIRYIFPVFQRWEDTGKLSKSYLPLAVVAVIIIILSVKYYITLYT